MAAVTAIYARENSKGMMFDVDDEQQATSEQTDTSKQSDKPKKSKGSSKPNLKLVDKSIEGDETEINKLLNYLSFPYHDSYLTTYNQVEREIAHSVYEVSLKQEEQNDSQEIPNLKKENSKPFKNYLKRVIKAILNRK